MESKPRKTDEELQAEDEELMGAIFGGNTRNLIEGTALPDPEVIKQYYRELELIERSHVIGAIAARDCLAD